MSSEEAMLAFLKTPRTQEQSDKALRACAGVGYATCVDVLLAERSRRVFVPSDAANSALLAASANGYDYIVSRLLAFGADPGANNSEALRIASANGNTRVVELILVTERADPAAQNNHALRAASAIGHTAIVKLLLDSGLVDSNEEALALARKNGHTSIAAMLR